MHLVGNHDELVEQMNKAGYRPEYADVMLEKIDGINDGSIVSLAEVEQGRFWVEITYDTLPGNIVNITGLAASLEGRNEWQEFEGLPSARQVWQQLSASGPAEELASPLERYFDPAHPEDLRDVLRQIISMLDKEGNLTDEMRIKYMDIMPPEMIREHMQVVHNHETINTTTMNENNLQYNKNLLEKLGFGTAVNDALEKFVIQQQPEIKLKFEATHFRDNVEYTLNFRKSDSTDMYFFNSYQATLKSNDEAFNRTQSFQIRNGNNITAQESFNLVAGRAVNKELFTGNGDRYEAWLKLDFSQKDKYGNHEVTQFHQNYGYDLEKALNKFPIKELADTDQKGQLLASLKKGNMQQVTMQVEGKDTKMFIEANPRFRTLNIRDELGNTVKRERVEKKDLSKTEKLDEALGKDKSQKQGKGKSLSV